MKVILNLITITLIGLLSSTYLLNLSPVDYRDSIEIHTPVSTSTLKLDINNKEKLINPETVVVSHTAEKNEVLKIVTGNIFTAKIYENNKLVAENIANLELVKLTSDTTLTINKDNPMVTTLDISKEKLGLKDGTYKIVLQSNLITDPNLSTIDFNVTYDTGGAYVPSMTTSPVGTKGLTLYFSTDNADALIPVTRFVVEDKSLTRMAIEQLQNGPLNTNMKTVIGDVTNCTYNNGNVVIDIPGSYLQYNSGSTGGLLAYEAFTKTIFDVDRYWPIYSISFTVDRKAVDNYFHGIDKLKAIPNAKKNYLIYLAYKINDRYYLFDYPLDVQAAGISDNDTIEIKAQKLFDAFVDTQVPYGISPIPNNITLQSAKADKKNLILDFNESFLKAYDGKDDLKMMMIESLVYSYSTIPNIEGIKITINSKPLTGFIKDKDLSGVLTPPKFINPEAAAQ